MHVFLYILPVITLFIGVLIGRMTLKNVGTIQINTTDPEKPLIELTIDDEPIDLTLGSHERRSVNVVVK